MLNRARNWFAIVLVAALLGFTGVLRSEVANLVTQGVFFVSAGFVVLSLLFSLFEETGKSRRAAAVSLSDARQAVSEAGLT
jgi:uncharacterized membrane protein YtjA (UPF0391 family)